MMQEETIECLWVLGGDQGLCRRVFKNPLEAFEHLSEDHVGRKSTNNLCLECHWNECNYKADKRDHVISHIRVHIPSYKPFTCTDCSKSFSRSQDLRKHQKIHGTRTEFTSLTECIVQPNSAQIPLSPPLHVYPNILQTSTAGSNQLMRRPLNDCKIDPHRALKRTRSKAQQQNVIESFLGDIKQKRLKPEYSTEMEATLNILAHHLLPPSSPTIHEPSSSAIDEEINWESLLTDDLPELNSFFLELHSNIQKPPLTETNETKKDKAPETVNDDDLMKYFDYEGGQRIELLRRGIEKLSVEHKKATNMLSDPSFVLNKLQHTRKSSNSSSASSSNTKNKHYIDSVSRSQSSNVTSSNSVRERHVQLIEMFMKQLDSLWKSCNNNSS